VGREETGFGSSISQLSFRLSTKSLKARSTARDSLIEMSFQVDDANPASLAEEVANSEDYRAPLNGDAPEPSIDGTSVNGGEGGVRAANAAEVGEEEKKVRFSRFSLDTLRHLFVDACRGLQARWDSAGDLGRSRVEEL
jgi:hypothetical protein